MTDRSGRLPPRVARLLERVLPPGIVREDVLGDLTEAYGRRARESRSRARLWLWKELLGIALHYTWARVTGVEMSDRRDHDEANRGQRKGRLMMGVTGDVRYALRGFVRTPGFAVAAILTIGLGVGANASIFSVVNGVLIQPLPWSEPDALVSVWPEKRWSGEMFEQVREGTEAYASLTLVRGGGYTVLGDGDAERVEGARVSDTYFDVLDIRAHLGRTFAEEDRFAEGGGVAVIGHGLWQRRYGGDPGIIGRTVRLAGFGLESRTIIGVLPENHTDLFGSAQVWTPVDMSAEALEYGGQYGFSVIGRLAPGRTVAAASAELRARVPEFAAEHPPQFRPERESPRDVVALRESMIGDARARLLLLLGAVAVVLLIACTNVANLLLARAVHRQREQEVRLALGARPARIVRQILIESGLLGIAGGAAGVLIAIAATPLLASPVASMMPRSATSVLDANVLLFAAAVSILAGLLFGSVSAVRFVTGAQGRTLHDATRASTGSRHRHRANNALVIAEVALAVLVVVAGSLLVKSFRTLIRQDPGFAADRLLAIQLAPPEGRYSNQTALEQYYTTIIERVGSLPGVATVSAIQYLPLTGSWAGRPYTIVGQEPPPGSAGQVVSFNPVTPDFLRTFDIPLLEGRGIEPTDRDGAPAVGVINEALRDRHWPGQSPLGQRALTSSGDPFFEVVGVVANFRQRDLDEEPAPEVYLSPWQASWNLRYLIVRGDDVDRLRGAIVSEIRALDRDVPVISARTMEEVIDDRLGSTRSVVTLFASFAILALVLGMIGIYGLISYTVSQRLREIGVRLALGATSRRVLGQTLLRAMALIATGVVIGIGLALAGTRLLASQLYGVQPTDPVVLTGAVLLMASAGGVAALLPALRAARSSPLSALRTE